jgi:hypothetical protein
LAVSDRQQALKWSGRGVAPALRRT